MRQSKGYTLTEIMIVVVILSVVAGLAMPSYFKTIEQSRINEAITTISIIHMAEKINKLNNNTFWDGGANATIAAIDTALNVDISATYYDDIDFSGVSATGYTVRLTRNASEGGNTAWYYQYAWNDTTKALTVTKNP